MHMGSTNVAHWAEVAPHKLDKIKIALVQLNVDLDKDALGIRDVPESMCRSKRSAFGVNLADLIDGLFFEVHVLKPLIPGHDVFVTFKDMRSGIFVQ